MSKLGILLLSDPSDPDFIEKIKEPFPDLEKAFRRDSMSLSGAILMLRGYYPGPWLGWVPNNADVTAKLLEEWQIYNSAREAIRGKILSAFLEESTYYVKLMDVFQWAVEKGISIDIAVHSFLENTRFTKKRGRPRDCPDVVMNIGGYFHSQGILKITQTDLKTVEDPAVKNIIGTYLKEAGISQDGKADTSRVKRRLKTLANNVNKQLQSATLGRSFCDLSIPVDG